MPSNLSISSIDAFSSEEKSPVRDRFLHNVVAAPLSEVKCDDQSPISFYDDASDTSALSSF